MSLFGQKSPPKKSVQTLNRDEELDTFIAQHFLRIPYDWDHRYVYRRDASLYETSVFRLECACGAKYERRLS